MSYKKYFITPIALQQFSQIYATIRKSKLKGKRYMSIDGIVLNSLVNELQSIIGSKINKIHVPKKDEILFQLKKDRDAFKLFITINANECRMSLTELIKENPLMAPPFCMVLRKYLHGGRITDITQVSYERIAKISILSADEMGDLKEYDLYVELMGKHSNVILCDDKGKILDCIKHIPITVSRLRQVLPGLIYELPPSQRKYKLNEISKVSLEELLSKSSGSLSKFILNTFEGLSPAISREIALRSSKNEDIELNTLTSSEIAHISDGIFEVFEQIKNKQYSPTLLLDTDKKPFSILPFKFDTYCSMLQIPQSSMNEAIDNFYLKKDEQAALNSKKSAISQGLKTKLQKSQNRLSIQLQTLIDAGKMDKYSLFGELITSNIYALKKGMDKVTLLNYYTGEDVEISLDKQLSPAQNAQKYYKRYNKLKLAQNYALKEKEILEEEIAYLESTLEALYRCENVNDIQDIRLELIHEGYIKEEKNKKNQKIQKQESKPIKYKSTDSFIIYAGKNNKQNDILTLKIAENDDLWLHTKDIHGTHVIIKTDKKAIPENTIIEAALIAAYNSKARHSQNVPVDYTKVQYVKKPSGAKPGMVIYTHQKTLFVTPDEQKVINLLFN